MEKILITGASGFFGSRLGSYYEEKFDIYRTDKNDTDITNEDSVRLLVSQIKPNYIVHAAAVPITSFCDSNPELAHKINVRGAVNIAKAADSVKAKVILLSTSQVFNGNAEPGPYKETDKPNPSTVYGENKLEAEKLLSELIEELWILRFTWLFGLPERRMSINENILWNTIQICMNGKPTKVTDNEFRGYTYVYDVIEQFNKIFSLPYGTYHVGSQNNLNRYEMTCFIINKLGYSSQIEKLIVKTHDTYRDLRLNTSKIKSNGFAFENSEISIEKCLHEYFVI